MMQNDFSSPAEPVTKVKLDSLAGLIRGSKCLAKRKWGRTYVLYSFRNSSVGSCSKGPADYRSLVAV